MTTHRRCQSPPISYLRNSTGHVPTGHAPIPRQAAYQQVTPPQFHRPCLTLILTRTALRSRKCQRQPPQIPVDTTFAHPRRPARRHRRRTDANAGTRLLAGRLNATGVNHAQPTCDTQLAVPACWQADWNGKCESGAGHTRCSVDDTRLLASRLRTGQRNHRCLPSSLQARLPSGL